MKSAQIKKKGNDQKIMAGQSWKVRKTREQFGVREMGSLEYEI